MPALSRLNSRREGLPLRPEVRLGLTLAASVAALIMNNPAAMASIFIASAIYLVLQVRLKTIAIAYLFFSAMAALALSCVYLLGFVFTAMKNAPASAAILPFARLGISINMILPLALYASLSGLLATMNRIWLPGVIKLPLVITIRFIPSFLNDLMQLRQAVQLKFRGRSGLLFWLRRPLLWWRVFFLPLVIRLIRSADELAVSAELKGLSAKTDFGRTKLELKLADRFTLLAWTVVLTLAVVLQVNNVSG